MADPTLETLETGVFSAANNGASAVYGNDAALVGAFGSLDIADNIAQDKSPIIIGPWRGLITATEETLLSWKVPSSTHNWELELWEMHVSSLPGMDGTFSGSGYELSATKNTKIYVKNDADFLVDSGALDLFAQPTASGVSYSVRLDIATNKLVSEGDYVHVVVENPTGVPSYLATISVLGYMRHRVK